MAIQRYRRLLAVSPGRPGHGTVRPLPRVGWAAVAAVAAVVAAGCSSSSTSSSSSASAPASTSASAATSSSPASSGSAAIPAGLGTSSFTVDIASTMAQFKPLTAAATKGAASLQVGVIMPDTTSSTRYVDFDAPYLRKPSPTPGTAVAVQDRQRPGQRRDRTEPRDRRHQRGRQGPDRGRARQPDRHRGREARRAKGRHPGRLRPRHLPGHEHLLRQLQQRARGRADRPGLRGVRQGMEHRQARRSTC